MLKNVWNSLRQSGPRQCAACPVEQVLAQQRVNELVLPFCRVNMGTADEFALDVLINALDTLSRE